MAEQVDLDEFLTIIERALEWDRDNGWAYKASTRAPALIAELRAAGALLAEATAVVEDAAESGSAPHYLRDAARALLAKLRKGDQQ